MQAEPTLSVLHPAHVYLAFSLKEGKKNLNLWTAASTESLCPRGALPWSLNINKYSWSFAYYFSPVEMETSSTPEEPLIYNLYTYFAIDFAP